MTGLSALRRLAREVRESLWFVPALMVAGAIALAIVLIWVDAQVSRSALERFPRLFGAGASGSRSMLAAIASSMITVAGVTFSITVVAVAQASSQYTSRVLRSFMRDRANQMVLGVFVGVFAYCLVVLRTIRGDNDLRFIPAIAVLVAFALAVVALGFLIFFIHHIADSLQAGTLLARVSRQTVSSIDRMFPDELGRALAAEALPGGGWVSLASVSSGYIQGVDPGALLNLAEREDRIIRIEHCIGDFIIEGEALASLSGGATPRRGLAAELNGCFIISSHRSVDQDVAFGIRQMADVALKALSPAVNDPSTAATSIDYLSSALARLANRDIPDRIRGRHGRVLVLARAPDFGQLLDVAFEEIRRNAAANAAVLERIVAALGRVGGFTPAPERRRHLVRHVQHVRETVTHSIASTREREHLERVCDAALAELRQPARPLPDPGGARGDR